MQDIILLLFILSVILCEGMIVVSNTYIPALNKKIKKDQKILAETDAGDIAIYTPIRDAARVGRIKHRRKRRRVTSGRGELGDDDDDDSDTDDVKLSDDDDDDARWGDDGIFEKAVRSITGANWRPKFTDRMTMFIAGAPGAGKSYLAKEMIGLLPKEYDILLFTALDEKDGNFDSFGKERLFKIKMDPAVLGKITLAEIRKRTKSPQVILLFDDVDKIRDPKVQNATFALMNDALANGRGHEKHDGKGDIHVICTSHSANDYQKTKYTFENSNYVALFPGTTPTLQMYRMFDKLGLSKELCYKMIRLGRRQVIRSVIIHKVVPMYMIYGDHIMLI